MIVNVTETDDKFVIEFDGMESALDYKDKLRDSGIYSLLSPNFKQWVVEIKFEDIIDNFRKEFIEQQRSKK